MNSFEITIQRLHNGSWPVIVRHQPGPIALTSWAQGVFNLDLQQLDQLLPAERQYGLLLGENIFRDQVREAFARAVSGATAASEPLRVWLIVEAEDLRSRHWEQLCAPFEGGRWDYLLLNQQTPFSLYLPSQIERRFPPISRRDLRALLLVAGPEDLQDDYQLARFDVPATVAALSASLGKIPHDVLASSVPGAVGEPSLNALSERLTASPYTLLFIVCHGAYHKPNGETILYLPEDERKRPVTGSKLLTRLSRLTSAHGLPHFTFLSTCESADPQAENGLGGLGQRLVRELGMPAVLAMTARVSIQTANALASALCARLGEHGEVDRALAEALTSLQARYDVTVPALFSRLGGRPLFSDALDRPLTANEIRYGLGQMAELLEARAPVLFDEFRSNSRAIQAGLEADPAALSPEASREFENALAAANQLSSQALDISFNAIAVGQKPPEYDSRSPFRGLYPFQAEDREFFFGRQALVDELAGRLGEHPFLAVLGPSGCGKSSLALAGLLPRLAAPVAYLTPGSDPLTSLESALAAPEPGMVLFVDQFEELFTLCKDEATRQAFLEQLLSRAGEMRVVITMRADFLGGCAAYPDLRRAIEIHQALIGPLSAEELRRAMERQADRVGLRFEAGLGEQILDDVQGEPGAMPLLQHALLLLWQRRHGRWLRWEEYTAIGGIREAIAHTAEEVYAGLSEPEKLRVRDIFTRLTRPPELERSQEGARYTRRRVWLDELVPAGSERATTTILINRLADARLVVTRQREATNEVEVEVAHEALIQHWPRLRAWLEENRTGILLREALTQAAREWEALGQEAGALYRGARLAQASEWAEDHSTDLNLLEKNFLVASQEQSQREQAARERQRNLILASALVVAIVMTFLGLLAFNRSQIASTQAATATYAQGEALYQASIAQTKEAEAVESGLVAEAQRLSAQGQLVLSEYPLLGLQLALEGWEILPKGNIGTQNQLQHTLRDAAKGGRLQSFGSNVERIYPISNNHFFVMDYVNAHGELRRPDRGEVIQLPDAVRWVYSVSDSPFFVVGYVDAPNELRRTDNADVVQLSGEVESVYKMPESDFFVVDYLSADLPDELRQTDRAEVIQLSGDLAEIFPLSDSPFFVVRYVDAPDELRRTDRSEAVQLPGEVVQIFPIPDSSFFVLNYIDSPGELRRTDSTKIIQLSGNFVQVFPIPDSPFFVVNYSSISPSGELRRTDSAEVIQLSGDLDQLIPIPDSPFFVVDYFSRNFPAELRRTDSTDVVQLLGEVDEVESIPDSPFFVVDYIGKPGELRRTDSTEIIQLSGEVTQVLPIPDSPFFVVDYSARPDELRRTDSAEIAQLPGKVTQVLPIPDSPFFVVDYSARPDELRRTDSTEIVQLSDYIMRIEPISDSGFLVINFHNGQDELWGPDSAPLLAMGLGVEDYFLSAGNRLLLWYTDGRGYLIDLDWLEAMGGRADSMPIDELVDLICTGPLRSEWIDKAMLQEYLGEREPQGCE